MKKTPSSFAARRLIAFLLLAQLTVIPSLVMAQQDTTTVCQIAYTSAPPVPWLAAAARQQTWFRPARNVRTRAPSQRGI